MSDDMNIPLSFEELQGMSVDPKLAQAAAINKQTPTDLSEDEIADKYGNFKLQRYTLFSIPSFTIFLQGPIADLPPIDGIEENYKDYFKARYCKVKTNAPTRTKIGAASRAVVMELSQPENYSRLYNDKAYHMSILGKIVQSGLDINKNLVANRHQLIATILEYRVGLDYWLKKNGYRNLLDWEQRTNGETLLDLRITKESLGDFFKNFNTDEL